MISNSNDLGPVLLYFVLLPTNLYLGQHSVKTVGLGSMCDRLGQLSQGLEAHPGTETWPRHGWQTGEAQAGLGYRPRAPVSPHVSFSMGSRASRASIPRDRRGSCHFFQTSPRRGASSLVARVTGRAVSTSMFKQEGLNPLLNGKRLSSFGASSLKPHCHPHTILIGHALLSVRTSSLNTVSAVRDLAPQLVRETFAEGSPFPSVAATSSAVKCGRRQVVPDGHLLQLRNMLCARDGGNQLPGVLSPTSPGGHMK